MKSIGNIKVVFDNKYLKELMIINNISQGKLAQNHTKTKMVFIVGNHKAVDGILLYLVTYSNSSNGKM